MSVIISVLQQMKFLNCGVASFLDRGANDHKLVKIFFLFT